MIYKRKKVYKVAIVFSMVILIILCAVCALHKQTNSAFAEETIAYTDKPVFTILTHGLDGDPTHWANNGTFNYNGGFSDDESSSNEESEVDVIRYNYYDDAIYRDLSFQYRPELLIEQLRRQGDADVYILNEQVDLQGNILHPNIDKFDINQNSPTGYSAENVIIPNFNKHCIFIYNSYKEDIDIEINENIETINDFKLSLEEVYDKFNFTINSVVESYRQQNNGVYPKMNLIGHSRGTMVNLKYATAYPDRIDSMFGLGGVYNGSMIASAIYELQLENSLGEFSDMLASQSVIDTTTDSYLNGLKNEWNSAVEGKDIKAYAVASSFDIEFLKEFIRKDTTFELNDVARNAIATLISAIQLGVRLGIGGSIESMAFLTALQEIYQITEINDTQKTLLSNLLTSMFSSLTGNMVIPMDGFIEVNSQAAIEYNNFERMYRNYSSDTNFENISMSQVGFPHNLETSDRRTINYILGNIDMGKPVQQYSYRIEDNEAIIERINKLDTFTSSLVIPNTLDDYVVAKIEPYAFSDNFNGNIQITSVTIPNTISEIETGVFADCENLETITFANNSILHTIKPYAFSNCYELSNISIPNSVTSIYEYAFNNCYELSNINIPNGVTSIYAYSFSNCYELSNISIPNSVTSIYEYAFNNCDSFTTFNLKNVETISYGVFASCDNLVSFSKNADNNDIVIDNSKAIYKDNILYSYACGNLDSSYTILENTTQVGESAFKGAENLHNVTFPLSLSYIGHSAFESCSNITSIEIHQLCANIASFAFSGCSLNNVTLYSNGNIQFGVGAFNGLSEDSNFYVPYNELEYYRDYANLDISDEQIKPITYTISFNTDEDTQTLPSQVVNYNTIVSLPMDSLIKVGYAFDGWYISNSDGTLTRYHNGSLYTNKGDLTLHPNWIEKEDGNIKFNANGGTGVMDDMQVSYNEMKVIPSSPFVKRGYEIEGFATSSTGSVKYEIGKSYYFDLDDDDINNILNLYAIWKPIEYTITYIDRENRDLSDMNLPLKYTIEDNETLDITYPGLVFYGWSYDTYYILKSTEGFAENLTLTAEWVVTKYMGSTTATYIQDTAVVLDFSGYSYGTNVNKTFTISKKVASLTLKDANNLQGLKFIIEKDRPIYMDIIFDNAFITGKDGYTTIFAPNSEIDLYCARSSTITGGTNLNRYINTDIDDVYSDCGAAIMTATLKIYDYDNGGVLTLVGGSGKDGTNGANGTKAGANQKGKDGGDGQEGMPGACAVIVGTCIVYSSQSVKFYGGAGGNGGNGGSGGESGEKTGTPSHGTVGATGITGGAGGNGGDGGKGACAIFVLGDVDFDYYSNVSLKNGKPGDSGDGGKGGKGGKGQKGGPGKIFVPAARGGTGGTGGTGGDSGDVFDVASNYILTLKLMNVTENYTALTTSSASIGVAGVGGDGGAGGAGGTKWPTGNLASTGYTGNRGASGSRGQ